MAWKYKISLTIVGLCLIFSILLLCSYKKYLQEQEETSLVIVDNGLSINYMQGSKIKVDKKAKTYTFSITNNNEEMVRYYIYLDNLNTNKNNIKYSLKEKNNKVNIEENELMMEEAYLASLIEIATNETHFYELTIEEEDKLNLNATLTVGIEDNKEDYFATTILKNNQINKSSQTKIGEEVALTDEGLIETTDERGVSYYFRGNVSNNYVYFADLMWRIVKINEDGSVKLILNNTLENTTSFYGTENEISLEDKLNFSKSNIAEELKNWYNKKLSSYDKYLVSNKYCVDASIANTEENTTYYLGEARLKIDFNQTFICLGNTYTERIGLLSADEVVFAGASVNTENTSFYLYTPNQTISWWTTTPSKSENENITYFEVSKDGKLQTETDGATPLGLKPVINLLKKTYVNGSGTEEDPYGIKE